MQEFQRELEIFKQQVSQRLEQLQQKLSMLESSASLPYEVESAIRSRLFTNGALPVNQGGTGVTALTGIPLGSGTSPFSSITPLTGTKVYYVSDASGGTVNRKLTFTSGVLTSET